MQYESKSAERFAHGSYTLSGSKQDEISLLANLLDVWLTSKCSCNNERIAGKVRFCNQLVGGRGKWPE
jgi:hypothetical protein